LSKDNAVKQKVTREERKKRAVRIMAMILAFLMVAGAATYTIMMLASAVSAEEAVGYTTSLDTSSLEDSGDVRVNIGLMYGDNITVGFQTTVTDGYTVGIQDLYGDREFTEIWELDAESVSVTSDDNLSKTGMTYLIADSVRDTDVGGYHVEVHCDIYDREEFTSLLYKKWDAVANLGFYMIPSYVYTGYALRIGSFADYDDAEYYVDEIEDIFGHLDVTVAYPTSTAVSVIDPYTDQILFEFDCGGEAELGLEAQEDRYGNTYIETPAGNVYDGVFAFKRYDNGETDGVSLINVVSLESYIAGVLPYETSNSWPMETQKAFAITVRSYTLTQMGKHGTHGFDLCNTTHCQVYKGAARINSSVLKAVTETKGSVITYDGNIISAYYSSSMGGVTVSAKDAWGGKQEYPYLKAVETPWEKYMVHNNGFWITEISPEALLDRLHQAGYTSLSGAVEDIYIKQLAENSTYVKVLGVRDIYGNTIEITNTDMVRTSLTPYVKSANFVVGKGSVEYTEAVVVESDYDYSEEYEEIISYDKDFGYIRVNEFTVMTGDGIRHCEREEDIINAGRVSNVNILTDEKMVNYLRKDTFVMSVENAGAFLGEEYNYENYVEAHQKQEAEKIQTSTTVITDKSTEDILYKIAYADDEDNFIFAGKGWGHGVGMSQYGALDLAELGYSAEDILYAYFTDIEIIPYTRADNFR